VKTAIVILNWNGKSLLEKFLPSVVANSPGANIYVADNASTDDSVAFVKSDFPEVGVIQNAVNGGYAKGYNNALEHLTEDLFILLNSDIETPAGWLAPIINAFEKDKNLGAAQPKILDYKNKDYFEYAGAAGGYLDKLGYPFCRGRIFQELEKDKGQYDEDAEIFWASGACLAVTRDVFAKAGKLDELYFAHQEEIDLCWRIKNLGYSIQCIGTSKVYHVGGATLQTMNPKKTFYNFRNSLFSLLKNVTGFKAYARIFKRMLLDGVAAFQFLLQGRPGHFFAILKAHMSFYTHFNTLKKQRKIHARDTRYYILNSVIWQHFAQGKKRFSQLSSFGASQNKY
tara:strand:- start:299 stop:1321 length:1023 start_codon:yes stop_codon:yes gene_type:complete